MDASKISIGDTITANDPRRAARTGTVKELLDGGRISVQWSGARLGTTIIAASRIFDDGKTHRSDYSWSPAVARKEAS